MSGGLRGTKPKANRRASSSYYLLTAKGFAALERASKLKLARVHRRKLDMLMGFAVGNQTYDEITARSEAFKLERFVKSARNLQQAARSICSDPWLALVVTSPWQVARSVILNHVEDPGLFDLRASYGVAAIEHVLGGVDVIAKNAESWVGSNSHRKKVGRPQRWDVAVLLVNVYVRAGGIPKMGETLGGLWLNSSGCSMS